PATSTARSRRSRSRTVSSLDYPQPPIEFARLESLHVGLDQPRQLGGFTRRDVASGNPGGERCHCAGCISSGSKCRQLEAYRPFASRWPVCFEQRQKQIVRVTPDRDGLTVIVSNELTGTDERFWYAFYCAPPRLVLKSVDGDFLGFLPSGGERRIYLPELADTGPASVDGCHAA